MAPAQYIFVSALLQRSEQRLDLIRCTYELLATSTTPCDSSTSNSARTDDLVAATSAEQASPSPPSDCAGDWPRVAVKPELYHVEHHSICSDLRDKINRRAALTSPPTVSPDSYPSAYPGVGNPGTRAAPTVAPLTPPAEAKPNLKRLYDDQPDYGLRGEFYADYSSGRYAMPLTPPSSAPSYNVSPRPLHNDAVMRSLVLFR